LEDEEEAMVVLSINELGQDFIAVHQTGSPDKEGRKLILFHSVRKAGSRRL